MLRCCWVLLRASISGVVPLLSQCQGCRDVQRGGDPARRPLGGELAERRRDVGESVRSFGPNVEVSLVAVELPARSHQDRFVAEWVEVADGEQSLWHPGQVVEERRDIAGSALVDGTVR